MAVVYLPFVMRIGQHRSDPADDRGFVGEDAHHAGAALDLLLIRSSGLLDQIFTQWARGNAANASTSALASSISGPAFGNDAASWSRTSSQTAE